MKRNKKLDPALTQRTSQENIVNAYHSFNERKFFVKAFNAFPDIVLVLDNNRQIIYANEYLLSYLGIKDVQSVIGKRVGETFNCVHAKEGPAGCGTSDACQECSALKAILNAQQGMEDQRQIHLVIETASGSRDLDFQVRVAPLHIDPDIFTIFTVKGIPLKQPTKV